MQHNSYGDSLLSEFLLSILTLAPNVEEIWVQLLDKDLLTLAIRGLPRLRVLHYMEVADDIEACYQQITEDTGATANVNIQLRLNDEYSFIEQSWNKIQQRMGSNSNEFYFE